MTTSISTDHEIKKPLLIDGVRRKREDRTVVAHISDLHFKSDTRAEDSIWQALLADLESSQVDLIAVSGDLIDGAFRDNWGRWGVTKAIDNAYKFLTETLCGGLDVDPLKALVVVPGNHDCRLKGLFSREALFDLFQQRFQRQFEHKIIPSLSLSLFVFDSNKATLGGLATGLVGKEDLVRFSRLIQDVSTSELYDDVWNLSTRVAMLHHHPMPIAATEHRGSITELEETLLLKNAGQFMTQMVQTQIDLVLHGHKHCPAFSKATFPTEGGHEHTVAVVAAGSVSRAGKHPQSYNLITIADSKEVSLQRKSLDDMTYKSVATFFLQPYEGVRRSRFERLAKRAGATLRVRKYSRIDMIKAGSGDTDTHETFESVHSYAGDDVPGIDFSVTSHSGFFRDPVFEALSSGLTIKWEWLDDQKTGPERLVRTNFFPPISVEPVAYRRIRQVYNAIYFNQRDRLDGTDDLSAQESVSFATKHAYELAIFKVLFPKRHIPDKFEILASYKGERDYREGKHAYHHLSYAKGDPTVVLALERPLPGYTYKIVWDLPEDEEEELKLDHIDAGIAEELIKRLLQWRSAEHSVQVNVQRCLEKLRNQIQEDLRNQIKSLQIVTTSDEPLEITLHAYDKEKRGLVCVAVLGGSGPNAQLWERRVKPGQNTIGQAYRRRQAVLWAPYPGRESEDAEFFDYDSGHTAILSVPLFYLSASGRRVAVISLASRSSMSELLYLRKSDSVASKLMDDIITQWYRGELLQELGLRDIAK